MRTDLRPDCTRWDRDPAHGPISPRVSGVMVVRCSCLEMDSSRSLMMACRNNRSLRTLTPETHKEEEEEEDGREFLFIQLKFSYFFYSCKTLENKKGQVVC